MAAERIRLRNARCSNLLPTHSTTSHATRKLLAVKAIPIGCANLHLHERLRNVA